MQATKRIFDKIHDSLFIKLMIFRIVAGFVYWAIIARIFEFRADFDLEGDMFSYLFAGFILELYLLAFCLDLILRGLLGHTPIALYIFMGVLFSAAYWLKTVLLYSSRDLEASFLYFLIISLVFFVIYALIVIIISRGKLIMTLLFTLSLMATSYFIWGYLFAVIMKIEPKVLTILMSVFVGGPYIHYFSYELRCLRKENLKG